MKISNTLYDVLNTLQRWLPAIGVLYLSLCKIWNLPFGQAVSDTILAISAFLAATLEIVSVTYHKDVTTQLLGGMVSGAFEDVPSEEEPAASEPSDAE